MNCFTNVSSRSEKKELGQVSDLFLDPPGASAFLQRNFSQNTMEKFNFIFFLIWLKKSCQNSFKQSNIKMYDQYGSFDIHFAIFYDIFVIW